MVSAFPVGPFTAVVVLTVVGSFGPLYRGPEDDITLGR
jgi:hypothetical protein